MKILHAREIGGILALCKRGLNLATRYPAKHTKTAEIGKIILPKIRKKKKKTVPFFKMDRSQT